MILHGGILDYAVTFGAGLLMSFTPCAYPLLPVTVAVVAGANTRGSHLNGFMLSVIYVLGLAVSYSALAAVAVLTGKVFGTIQNNPWVFVVIGNLILFFALVMLDFIPFPMFSVPSPGQRPRGRRALFLMGAASGFVVGPCTAPVLGSLLLYIGSKHNLLFGMSLLFTFAFGLGTSLILAGTFSGFLSVLPKSGQWMNLVKKAAGIVLIIISELMFLRAGSFWI
ncbi:MAG: sulfite exporter TauE/SafE family protein [Candidatus Omnitrophica bacterium]|nr:sulfite exporter TauE/SafE family protein [Candidatus Omnitrophota bacterium]